jgi:hypothetical protein
MRRTLELDRDGACVCEATPGGHLPQAKVLRIVQGNTARFDADCITT